MRLLQSLSLSTLVILAPTALLWTPEAAAEIQLRVESGAAWQGRNDVQIPSDSGTRFELDEVIGDDAEAFFRFAFEYTFEGTHGLRLVYAPLRLEERGELAQPVEFAGSNFEAGDVDTRYKFDSHRVTYRYRVLENSRWHLDAGITALIRDAEIRLQQPDFSARDTDTGIVPLAHLAGAYQLSDRFRLSFDFDGLAAAQGRAFDLGLRAEFAMSEQWDVFAGYRILEGGVDNDEVYNFALFNFAVFGLNYRY